MYGLIGRMHALAEDRDRVMEVIGGATTGMPGCLLYTVAADVGDPTAIWITEVWESEEAHRASLELPAVRAAIAEAGPLLTGGGERHVVRPVSGFDEVQ